MYVFMHCRSNPGHPARSWTSNRRPLAWELTNVPCQAPQTGIRHIGSSAKLSIRPVSLNHFEYRVKAKSPCWAEAIVTLGGPQSPFSGLRNSNAVSVSISSRMLHLYHPHTKKMSGTDHCLIMLVQQFLLFLPKWSWSSLRGGCAWFLWVLLRQNNGKF